MVVVNVKGIKEVVMKGFKEFLDGMKQGYRQATRKQLSMGQVYDVMTEVINTWAPVINAELDMQGLPVHIERLISDNDDTRVMQTEALRVLGLCLSQVKSSRHINNIRMKPVKISLYAEAFTNLGYTDRNTMYKAVLFILAHEIRHSYQSHTGQMVSKQEHTYLRALNMFSFDLPYNLQWCELDANKWAKWFVDKHVHGVTAVYEEVPGDHETEDYMARAQAHSRQF